MAPARKRTQTTRRTRDAHGASPPVGKRDGLLVLALLIGCLGLIAGLRLIAADGESAGQGIVHTVPTPVASTNEGCTNFARYWMVDSGVGGSAETIEALGNCRQAADGTWFVPTDPRDPRLPPEALLTQEERQETAAERAEILSEIAALEATMPQTLRRWLNEMYDPIPRAMTGHIRDGFRIGVRRGRYTRLIQAFLMDPRREALANYVGWIMGRRIAAYEDFLATCLRDKDLAYLENACRGVEDQLSIRFPPFPWDLKDPLMLDAYFAAQLRENAAEPAATPASE